MSNGPVDPNVSLNNQPYQPNQQPNSPYSPNTGNGYTPAGQNPIHTEPTYGQMPPSQDPNVWGGNSNGGQPGGLGPQKPQSPLKWILIAVVILVLAVGGFFGVRALTGDNEADPKPSPTASATTSPKPEETTTPDPEETTTPEPEETTPTEPEDTEPPLNDGSGWQGDVYVYTSQYGYTVEFPGEPTVQELDDPFGGDIPMEIAQWEQGDDFYQAAFGPQRAEGLTPSSSVIGSSEGIGATNLNLQGFDVANAEAMAGDAEYMGQQVWLLNALSITDDSVYMLLQSGAERDNAFFDSLDIRF